MQCPISSKAIQKAKDYIKVLEKRKKVWQEEIDKLNKKLESCADKHYSNIKKNRDSVNIEIEKIDEKIKEFQDAIDKGYIEI